MPVGFDYESGFLSLEEEAGLIAVVKRLPLESARYKTYTARRRVLNYGGCFDFDANRLRPAEDLHPDLMP